jgi:hypothetical protein
MASTRLQNGKVCGGWAAVLQLGSAARVCGGSARGRLRAALWPGELCWRGVGNSVQQLLACAARSVEGVP